MAIKFFFSPTSQNVSAELGKILTDKLEGKTYKGKVGKLALDYFKKVLTLPVNPQSLTITTASDNKKTNVINLGQIVIPKGVNLSTLEIESFFPAANYVVGNLINDYVPPYIVMSTDQLFNGFTSAHYFSYFQTLQLAEIPTRLIISDCDVDMDVLVESITKRFESDDGDLHYTLKLTEYRHHKATELTKKPTIPSVISQVKKVIPAVKPRRKTGLAAGDIVIANGKYFYDSFGSSPFGTFKNFKGKISHLASNNKATHKYHVTTLDGGWRGWVTADQIKGVD